MEEKRLRYEDWVEQIKNFKGGWPGVAVALLTLAGCIVGSVLASGFFPSGTYPKIVLAIPGLIAGGAVFVIASLVFWPVRMATLAAADDDEQGR